MPNPGKTEPGSTAGHPDMQQQSSVQFSSSIPIKKRRFPIIRSVSPSLEEKASESDANDSKIKQDSGIISDEKLYLDDVKNIPSPGNSAVMVKNEQDTLTNIESGQSNSIILAFKPQQANALVSLGSTRDLMNKRDSILSVTDGSNSTQMATVKQEIISARAEGAPRLELSMASMNVELLGGTKEPLFPSRSEKSDLSLLSLASSEEKLALHDNDTTDNVGSGVNADRSNWDLNTTMDVWEDSVNGDAVDSGGLSDAKLALDSGVFGFSLNKGKQILNSNSSAQNGLHYRTGDALGLQLSMPFRDLVARMDCPLSDKLVSTSVNFPQARQSAVNVNSSVKSEPIDENSKHNRSIGSCSSSSNMGLLKISSLKSEIANNLSLGASFPSSSPEKSVDHMLIKSEVVEQNQEVGKHKDIILHPSVARVMQHQDSCASSSALPVPPRLDSYSTLPTSRELNRNSDLSNQSEHSSQSKESRDHNDRTDDHVAGIVSKSVSQDDNQSTSSNVGNSNLEAPDKAKLAKIDEHAIESCQSGVVTGNDEEKINIPAGVLEEEPFGSDSESQEMDIDDENVGNKEYEEYEDGEVREPSKQDPIEEKVKDSEVGHSSQNPSYPVSAGDGSINASSFEAKDNVKKLQDEPSSDMIKDRVSIGYESNNKVRELGVDEKKFISVSSDKQLETPGRMVTDNSPSEGSHGAKVPLTNEAADKVIKEICSGENDSTLSKEEACLNDYDARDSNNIGNKSRIINLSRATSAMASPSKTRYIPNRLLSSRSGKERYSDLDADIQPRTNREEFYIGGSKKFVKDRIHDRPFRNSFVRGKGRGSGRFGSMRREWDSDSDFISENYRGPTDYRVIRRKSNVDLDCSGYDVSQDGAGLGRGRRKVINDEFPPLRRQSLRTGDRDGSNTTRGIQMLRRMPRNMSPNRCPDEDCSEMIEVRHGSKFMRHLPDDGMDPVFNRQPVYEELDGQPPMRRNRNFPIIHGNGYHPRMGGGSKSPVRSRTRSPGPWSSPRRRSPNGPPPDNIFRMGRMRSPDPFRNEMMTRRRGSPPFPTRHPNESRDMDSEREQGPHRPANSHRRSSPGRSFPRPPRRGDVLDSEEMVEGNTEFINSPLHPGKFHGGEGSSEERRSFMRNSDERRNLRNFMERRGQLMRPFRPTMYGGGGENDDEFQFHQNEGGPRQFRFCPDMDSEFIERNNNNNLRREFDDGGHVKHHHHHQQPMMQSRRIRNIEEQGNVEGTWHEDGYTDNRMKRIRF